MKSELVKEPDVELLQREFAKVNRKYFKEALAVDIVWEVPPKDIVATVKNQSKPIAEGSPAGDSIKRGILFAAAGDLDKAASTLIPFAERGYKDAVEAMIQIERARHRDYIKWAAIKNAMDEPIRRFPAACVNRDIGRISIHPMLGHMDTPRYVIAYLIFHECLHLVFPTSCEDPHPESFMVEERRFLHREKARTWLIDNGFPVVAE